MHVEPMMFNFYCFMSHVYFFHSKCVKQLLDLFFFGLKWVINNVEVRVINLAFGLADNSYFNNDSFAYHSKQIQ